MLNRLKTAATGSSSGVPGDSGSADSSGRWSRKSSKTAERDQFRVQQQGFYVRGDLTVDIFQARGLRSGPAGDRNTYCVVLVDRERVGETSTAPKTLSPVWNHPVKVAHEHVRRAADMNVWPVPYQPLSIQVWDRSNSSDTLLGTARVPITDNLGNGDANGWHRLVGTGGDQAGAEELCGKIRIKVHWESQSFARSPEDEPRFFLRDVFGHDDKDYQHLYYGGLSSTLLAPPAGEEVLLEMMSSISRHDITANGHGKGVEGMLVLTELRLLFLPDISRGSTTTSYLEFHTVQVYLAAVRNFSHRGLEGGSRLLSITTRDGRFIHFRMPAMASSARCGAWFDAECSRRRVPGSAPGSGGEELWKRGLWGAGSSEQWMERLADEIRWRKAHGDFVALWHKVCETSSSLRATVTAVARAASNAAAAAAAASNSAAPAGFYRGAGGGGGGMNPSSSAAASAAQHHHGVPIGGGFGARVVGCGGGVNVANVRGDAADGWAALERDLERVGVPSNGSGYAGFGRQMWEFKRANKDYGLSPTYPQVLAFPSSLTPAQLTAAAPQRSRSRVPALVWLHPASKAPLVRSSQPMAGMTTKVLNEDIHLLKQIRVTLDATKLSIVDARSLLNAKANQVTGKGYEDVNDIGRDVATLNFMGIENIHSVRDSLAAYCSASQAQGQEFYHAVGASGWLRHLSQIMKGAAFVVDELQRGVAVLVHCSDGWDRTAQLTALAQLYLDPYYRTLEGFEVLVEKEWGSFGHMFGMRAHSDSPTESSPVFLQWLDAVWQLLRQYPSSFEFTGHYLERLVEGLYSAAFITFSGNCERERKEKLKSLHSAGSGAVSLFVYLREHAMEGHMTAPLLNALYRPPRQGASGGRGPSVRTVDVLRPCCELQGLEIWQAVFMRDNLLLHHKEHQLSVEQGLRLQVYDYKRRMDMVESQMDRLPRGLKLQLQSSATGMGSPDWDGHRRLTDQLSADQDAAAAAAAAGASTSASTSASIMARGRSQSRAARSGHADDGSRSRSRSFNIPIRGWGGGNKAANNSERRQRWASQEWDPPRGRQEYNIEEEVGQYGPSGGDGGAGGSESSGPTTSGGYGGGGGGGGAAEEDLGERTSRGKSLFGFGGRGSGSARYGAGGGALSRLTPAVVSRPTAAMGDSSDESEEEDSTAGDPRAGGGKGIASFGRRRATSMAGSGGGDGSKSRNSRFSSFSGERPSSSAAPSTDAALGLGNAAQTAVTFNPVTQVQGGGDGSSRMGRSHSMVEPRLPPEVARVHQQQEAGKFSQKKKGWGRGRASSAAGVVDDEVQMQRRLSSVGVQQEEYADERMAGRGSRLASQAMYAAGSSSMGSDSNAGAGGKGGLWPFSRNKKRGGGGVGAGASGARGVGGGVGRAGSLPKADVKKGVWGSLQRTLGGSSKQPGSNTVPVQGRSPHHFQQPPPSHGSAVARATATAARREKAAKSQARAADENDANSAARLATRLKAEEDAESRRQMQHTIATLEVQLLVKDIVDSACARVAERACEKSSERSSEPSNRSAPPSVSSSTAPAPHPRLSATALQAERPTFFGTFWGGGDTGGGTSNGGATSNITSSGTGNGGGGVTGQWGGQEKPAGERQVRRHTNATDMAEPYGATIWRGGAREAAPGGAGGGGAGAFPEEEEGFFQSLRRKIFEGDNQREAEAEASREAAAAIAASNAAAPTGSEPPSVERSTKRSGPGEGVSPASSKAMSTPSAMQAALRYTPVRSAERGESHGSPSFGMDSTGSFSTRLTSNGSSTPVGVRLARPIRAPSSSGAGAGPGTGGYSPIITIPTTHGADTPPPQHPDAGAGGIRSVDRGRASSIPVMHMAPDVAEEAAAKFGLVRMVFGDVGQ